jgi:site-specific recombinase XerD
MANKGLRFPAEPLTGDEVRALLAACGGDRLTDVRNHALLVTLWRAGLRCSEALSLRPVDVDFERGTIRVLHGKGRKARTVGIDDTALAVLAVWIERRPLPAAADGALFCTTAGTPMCTRYVRAMVARLAVKAGIRHRVHPHAMRHTHAVELSREGWPVPLISRQLGHSNVGTTDTYLNHLFPAEVVDRARARSWG